MMILRKFHLSVALLVMALAPARAMATNAAGADAAFEEGRRLLAAGQVAWACAKFEESQRLDPATGTLLNLAACHESLGRLASAWAEFRAAELTAAVDKRPDRVAFAHQHAAALAPRTPRLALNVADDAKVPGLKLWLDGTELSSAAASLDIPLDPGAHQIEALAPGRERFRHTVQVDKEGARLALTVAFPPAVAQAPPPIAASAGLTPPKASGPVALPLAPAPPAPGPSETPPLTVEKDLDKGSEPRAARSPAMSLALAGAGAALLATGAFFGMRSFQQWSDFNKCNGEEPCQSSAHKNALNSAHLADVAIPLGIAGLGAGAYLWWGSTW